MGICIKPSDLKYRYPKAVETRFEAKFQGASDPAPFNRDDIYDIIPLLEAVMDQLGRDDGRTLHLLEDLLNEHLPRFVVSRGEVYLFLANCAQEIIEEWQ
ncbi:hypothetical protein [Geomesophilobacter sediminis]|uniref:Uncharacterized protein n=1 Tax=Geomesophilobacter sediminis TaxID=2798584 RepID=A0A8J7INS3_9BACT|nr:hypothetical protein [Geomesophilobacter sediminis]MBJ6724968.1 hypothetical protein [Geomesophilobacter sediminis]